MVERKRQRQSHWSYWSSSSWNFSCGCSSQWPRQTWRSAILCDWCGSGERCLLSRRKTIQWLRHLEGHPASHCARVKNWCGFSTEASFQLWGTETWRSTSWIGKVAESSVERSQQPNSVVLEASSISSSGWYPYIAFYPDTRSLCTHGAGRTSPSNRGPSWCQQWTSLVRNCTWRTSSDLHSSSRSSSWLTVGVVVWSYHWQR